MHILELLTQDNYLMYNLRLAKTLGIYEAILIGEFARKYNYWLSKGQLTEDEFFFITHEDVENDTGLSEHQQRKALKNLIDKGIVLVEKKGGLNRANYYKVVNDALLKYLTYHGLNLEGWEVKKVKDTNTTNTNTISTNIKKDKIKTYGEYNHVKFTDIEYSKLKEEFPNDYNDWIKKVDEYVESKGIKEYKNNLLTIRNWAKRASEWNNPGSINQNKKKPVEIDWDNLKVLKEY